MHQLIEHYGLLAVYLGAAIEGDASVMAGGVLFHKGLLPFWPLVLTAALGAWTSDLAIYGLARRATRGEWIAKQTAAVRRNRFLGHFLARPFLLALSFRFIPGARTIGPVALATAGEVRPAAYVAMTAVAGLVWSLVLVLFGQVFGHLLERILGELRLHTHLAIWSVAILLSLAAAVWVHRRWYR